MAKKVSRRAHAREKKAVDEVGNFVFYIGAISIGFGIISIFATASMYRDTGSSEFFEGIAVALGFIASGAVAVGYWYWVTHSKKTKTKNA